MTRAWERRFAAARLLTVRPTADHASSALVVIEDGDGAHALILDGATETTSEPLPVPVHYDSLLTPDRRWVVQLADDNGSEVGHLCAFPVDGGAPVDLTPDSGPYVVRGLDISACGSTVVAALVDDDGHRVVAIPAAPWGAPHVVASTPHECWLPRVSADGRLVSADTTDHNPGIRRPAVSVFEVASGERLAMLDDLPAGPVRAVRFSGAPGDSRLLLSTERTGFARPAVWDPLTGRRADFDLPDLRGDVQPLDWHAASGRVLVLHVEDGLHRLCVLDAESGALNVVREGTGSYAQPDVASSASYYACSYLASDGTPRALEQSWASPPRLVAIDGAGRSARELQGSEPVPEGRRLRSVMVPSHDGTPVQLWWTAPLGDIRGTVLEVHGGPNLVTTDLYSPDAQAWLEEGYAYASLNYRGSVTFGRAFREGFWGVAGDREVEDVDAAIGYLRGVGLADPASTFITGASYGGHLSLLAAGRLPGRFAGVLAHVAMADWATAFEDMNPSIRDSWTNFLTSAPPSRGPRLSFAEAVAKFSPLSYVGDVTASVWLFQGTHDSRTPPEQARRYAEALQAAGGDVVLEFFEAGHEPVGLDRRLYAQRRMLELAEAALAGRRWDQLEG
jgi:dipeptidyl aminopeptidase/acylaminoacyl peptidase